MICPSYLIYAREGDLNLAYDYVLLIMQKDVASDYSWAWAARPENPGPGRVGLACRAGFGPHFGARTSS
jgi:hypothetical protein